MTQIDTGTTAWMLTSTALVLLMVPGLAMFYGGLVRTKNVLGTMMHSFGAMVVIGALWIVCGYAMAFGRSALGGWIGWDPTLLFLSGIDEKILSAGIPEYVFAMFQGKFAIITPAILAGAFAERVKFREYCIFIALWSLLVYVPVCHWVWQEEGFLFKMGAIDFAGGTVVHITAGVSGLVAALYLGSRKGFPINQVRPSNLVMTMIGAGLLWVGWFGFNAGSAISSGLQTAQALVATQVAAASGGLAWLVIETYRHGKATSVGVASGILAGLVVITPAAGVARPLGAMIMGALAAMTCYLAIQLKNTFRYDDTLDAFGIHGIAGILGALILSFFIRPSEVARRIAEASTKGEIWTVPGQLGVQALGVAVTIVYSAAITWILLVVLNKISALRLKEPAEMAGMDYSLHGEIGYGHLNLD
jgi:ammonium transporter, Amt family